MHCTQQRRSQIAQRVLRTAFSPQRSQGGTALPERRVIQIVDVVRLAVIAPLNAGPRRAL
jgi:hypothetical protein